MRLRPGKSLRLTVLLVVLWGSACGPVKKASDPAGGKPDCALSETWTSVDRYAESGVTPVAEGIVSDPDGLLFAVGGGSSGSAGTAAVRKSSDAGSTWSVAFARHPTTSETSVYHGAATSASGRIFAVGEVRESPKIWMTSVSTNNGGSWDTGGGFAGESFNYVSGQESVAYAVAVQEDETAWVVGAGSSGGVSHWISRKGTSKGVSWATSDDFQLDSSHSATARAVTIDSSGTIYVAGGASGATGEPHWIVRKSADQGASWATIDDFACELACEARSIAIARDESLVVAGRHLRSDGGVRWLVRRSSDGGTTWSSVDEFTYSSGHDSEAQGAGVDRFGNLYVVGKGKKLKNSLEASYWIVRRSSNDGQSWTTVDEFLDQGKSDSAAYSVTTDPSGSVYVAGGSTGSTESAWVTRKLACE